MARSKQAPRALTQTKQTRRKWLTFVRMCRYGINNFSRNLWLTIAATAVILRSYTRLVVIKQFGYDDIGAIISLVCYPSDGELLFHTHSYATVRT